MNPVTNLKYQVLECDLLLNGLDYLNGHKYFAPGWLESNSKKNDKVVMTSGKLESLVLSKELGDFLVGLRLGERGMGGLCSLIRETRAVGDQSVRSTRVFLL